MKQITLFFAVQVLRRTSGVYTSKYLKETINGILNGGKTLRERILKKLSVCEIHYSKYQLIKSMCKIITSVSGEIT